MSEMSVLSSDEHRRKRVRKGTKSCWECKRRKIRCQLSSEDVSICAGCLVRGTSCVSQEYPEEHDNLGGNQIGERLGRVELLLDKLVSKITHYDEEEKATRSLHTPESIGPNDVLAPEMSNASSNEQAPILSLFDNPVIGRREAKLSSLSTTSSPQASGPRTPSCRLTKTERLCQTLAALLPSQQATNAICEASSCWLLLYAFSFSKREGLVNKGSSCSVTDLSHLAPPAIFNVNEISKQNPIIIARTLLYLAVCLQQVPSNFDTSRFDFPSSIESRMDRYISTVQSLVTSDDELVSSIEGLECLILLGIFHMNAGNPRRSWLLFRKALNISQMMGLHRRDTPVPGGRDIWFEIVHADRYMGLLLGMPCGSGDDEFGPEETLENPDISWEGKTDLFRRKLCQISGSIIERNANSNVLAYAATQEIEDNLEKLAKAMPAEWWVLPKILPNFEAGDAVKIAEIFERTLVQVWYFQLEALLHLPFMVRAATERRFEYSKFCCLKASRAMLQRYQAIKEVEDTSFNCQVLDFAALVATATLLLGILEGSQANETAETKQQKEADRQLVRRVEKSMAECSTNRGDLVSKQCANVIQTLLAADSPSRSNSGNLRLTIPYFGTINIIRPPPAARSRTENSTFAPIQQRQDVLPNQSQDLQGWQGIQYPQQPNQSQAPLVSFTSSQFAHPELQVDDWGLQEADTLFFDSLLNTDLEGNWNFDGVQDFVRSGL